MEKEQFQATNQEVMWFYRLIWFDTKKMSGLMWFVTSLACLAFMFMSAYGGFCSVYGGYVYLLYSGHFIMLWENPRSMLRHTSDSSSSSLNLMLIRLKV